MNIERIKENYKLACRTNGDFNTKLNDELFEYIYKLENIISGDEVITEKQKELIDKIKEIIEETKYHDDYYENNCEIEKEKLKNILDLIKEYENND